MSALCVACNRNYRLFYFDESTKVRKFFNLSRFIDRCQPEQLNIWNFRKKMMDLELTYNTRSGHIHLSSTDVVLIEILIVELAYKAFHSWFLIPDVSDLCNALVRLLRTDDVKYRRLRAMYWPWFCNQRSGQSVLTNYRISMIKVMLRLGLKEWDDTGSKQNRYTRFALLSLDGLLNKVRDDIHYHTLGHFKNDVLRLLWDTVQSVHFIEDFLQRSDLQTSSSLAIRAVDLIMFDALSVDGHLRTERLQLIYRHPRTLFHFQTMLSHVIDSERNTIMMLDFVVEHELTRWVDIEAVLAQQDMLPFSNRVSELVYGHVSTLALICSNYSSTSSPTWTKHHDLKLETVIARVNDRKHEHCCCIVC